MLSDAKVLDVKVHKSLCLALQTQARPFCEFVFLHLHTVFFQTQHSSKQIICNLPNVLKTTLYILSYHLSRHLLRLAK